LRRHAEPIERAAARSSQPSALQLAIVPAFQPLAELLGAVAFHRPPDQRVH
jgi:hypothetical protein